MWKREGRRGIITIPLSLYPNNHLHFRERNFFSSIFVLQLFFIPVSIPFPFPFQFSSATPTSNSIHFQFPILNFLISRVLFSHLGFWPDRMEPRIGNKFRLGRKIGSGSFGEIYLGMMCFLQSSYLWFFFVAVRIIYSLCFLFNFEFVFFLQNSGTNIQTNEEVAIKLVSIDIFIL